jgi:AmiR/NasT family two-component response regulator
VKSGAVVLKRPLPKRALAGKTAYLEVIIRSGKGRVRVVRPITFLARPEAAPVRPIVMLVNAPTARRTLASALKGTFQVGYSTTSADIYRMLSDRKRKIHVVVIDVSRTPTKHDNRIGLVRNVRYLFPGVKVVVASNSAKVRSAAVKAGAHRVISSPLKPGTVGGALRSMYRR